MTPKIRTKTTRRSAARLTLAAIVFVFGTACLHPPEPPAPEDPPWTSPATNVRLSWEGEMSAGQLQSLRLRRRSIVAIVDRGLRLGRAGVEADHVVVRDRAGGIRWRFTLGDHISGEPTAVAFFDATTEGTEPAAAGSLVINFTDGQAVQVVVEDPSGFQVAEVVRRETPADGTGASPTISADRYGARGSDLEVTVSRSGIRQLELHDAAGTLQSTITGPRLDTLEISILGLIPPDGYTESDQTLFGVGALLALRRLDAITVANR